MSLGARMAHLRLQQHESLQDVADAVGVSKAHIWELEKGRAANPSMTLLQGVADHFGVKISFLIGEDVDSPDADQRLARMFRQARELSEDDLDLIDSMITIMLARNLRGKEGRRASTSPEALNVPKKARQRRLKNKGQTADQVLVGSNTRQRKDALQATFKSLVRRTKRSLQRDVVADHPSVPTDPLPETAP